MKIDSKDFRVRHGDKVKLRKWPTIPPSSRATDRPMICSRCSTSCPITRSALGSETG